LALYGVIWRFEAGALLNLQLGVEVPYGVCAALTARTEGWAAGLRLAALSLQDRSDLSGLSPDVLGRNRSIIDYLMDEVFSRQTPALQDLRGELRIVGGHREG
jgi:LuxR family maltose regulon positive regulatory protein